MSLDQLPEFERRLVKAANRERKQKAAAIRDAAICHSCGAVRNEPCASSLCGQIHARTQDGSTICEDCLSIGRSKHVTCSPYCADHATSMSSIDNDEEEGEESETEELEHA